MPNLPPAVNDFICGIEVGLIKLVPDEDPHGVIYDGGECWYAASNGWRIKAFFDVDVLEAIHEIRDENDARVSDWFPYTPGAEIERSRYWFFGAEGCEVYGKTLEGCARECRANFRSALAPMPRWMRRALAWMCGLDEDWMVKDV
jgi:hypothetical protein